MGQTLSTPEKIAKLAKHGDYVQLRVRQGRQLHGVGGRASDSPKGRPRAQRLPSPRPPEEREGRRHVPLCSVLQELLAGCARHEPEYQRNRARYLEVQKEDGSTPLTLAAERGHVQVRRRQAGGLRGAARRDCMIVSAGGHIGRLGRKQTRQMPLVLSRSKLAQPPFWLAPPPT